MPVGKLLRLKITYHNIFFILLEKNFITNAILIRHIRFKAVGPPLSMCIMCIKCIFLLNLTSEQKMESKLEYSNSYSGQNYPKRKTQTKMTQKGKKEEKKLSSTTKKGDKKGLAQAIHLHCVSFVLNFLLF